VFDVLGGDIAKRSAGLIRAGGTLVTITGPTKARPADGRTVDFVVVPDRAQLTEIVRRVRDGRLRTNIGTVEAVIIIVPPSRLCPDAVYYATRHRGASNEKARRELEFHPHPLEWI
jgi:hypothetical protein